jgi:hypothetical protein
LNNDTRDDVSVSSNGSGTIKTFSKRTKNGLRKGIQLDI